MSCQNSKSFRENKAINLIQIVQKFEFPLHDMRIGKRHLVED